MLVGAVLVAVAPVVSGPTVISGTIGTVVGAVLGEVPCNTHSWYDVGGRICLPSSVSHDTNTAAPATMATPAPKIPIRLRRMTGERTRRSGPAGGTGV